MYRKQTSMNVMRVALGIFPGVAGMLSKTTVAPLDRIKILLQAHNKHHESHGVIRGIRHIVQHEGFYALYKGNGAQMVRIFPYAATQFTSFEMYKRVSFQGISSIFH